MDCLILKPILFLIQKMNIKLCLQVATECPHSSFMNMKRDYIQDIARTSRHMTSDFIPISITILACIAAPEKTRCDWDLMELYCPVLE